MRLVLPLTLALAAGPAAAQAPHLSPDGSWQAVQAGEVVLTPEDGVTLTFAKGRVSGSAGCNRFFGGYTQGLGLAFAGIGTTRMACSGRAADVERAVLAALGRVDDWRLADDNGLELLQGAEPVLRAVPAP